MPAQCHADGRFVVSKVAVLKCFHGSWGWLNGRYASTSCFPCENGRKTWVSLLKVVQCRYDKIKLVYIIIIHDFTILCAHLFIESLVVSNFTSGFFQHPLWNLAMALENDISNNAQMSTCSSPLTIALSCCKMVVEHGRNMKVWQTCLLFDPPLSADDPIWWT